MKILSLCFSEDFINHELTVGFLFHLARKSDRNVYDAGIL